MTDVRTDFKNPSRIRDVDLMKRLHLTPGVCPLCLIVPSGIQRVSLHHLLSKGPPYMGDDVRANLQWLCGSGTTGHHGLIEHEDHAARRWLGEHVIRNRPDFIGYLEGKLGSTVAADEWLRRRLYAVRA